MWDIIEAVMPIFMVIAVIIVILFMIMIPVQQLETRAFIQEFKQVKNTVDIVRLKNEMPEADRIIEINQLLAKWKYYNGLPIIGWTITDMIDDLEPIE